MQLPSDVTFSWIQIPDLKNDEMKNQISIFKKKYI